MRHPNTACNRLRDQSSVESGCCHLYGDEHLGLGTLRGDLPRPVPDGVLRLQGEEEGGGEPVNL